MGASQFPPVTGTGGAASGDFVLSVGSGGDTTYILDRAYPAGRYLINFLNGDSVFDIYFIGIDGTYSGYTNETSASVFSEFSEIVIIGANSNETVLFSYQGAITSPSSLGDVSTAGAFINSISVSEMSEIDDSGTILGGNFAPNLVVEFIGQNQATKAAKSVTWVSSTEAVVVRPDNLTFDVAETPYSIRVSNPGIPVPSSTQAHILPNAVAVNNLLASGGTQSVVNGFAVHTFNASGNFSVLSSPLTVEYIVMAGGGAGGPNAGFFAGAGGGGGGYRSSIAGQLSGGNASAESALTLSPGSYTVTIGAGGAVNSNSDSTNGAGSTFANITAVGGGRGHPGHGGSGFSGGSGGGGSRAAGAGGSGTTGQGLAGMNASFNDQGGGGGGAGQGGITGQSVGGLGRTNVLEGRNTHTWAAGGGGQLGSSNNVRRPGGSEYAGSARAGISNTGAGNGAANFGGGGGGGGGGNPIGGAGGSGKVIVRYAI